MGRSRQSESLRLKPWVVYRDLDREAQLLALGARLVEVERRRVVDLLACE